MRIELVSAGVDEGHQTDHCDDCGHVFDNPNPRESEEEIIQTCSHTEYLTLCRKCYGKRGNSVR